MAVYGTNVCDASGTFTTMAKTGDGNYDFDTVNKQEGSASVYFESNGLAGTAYGISTLSSNIASGNYFHASFDFAFMRAWDWATPSEPAMSASQACWQLYSSGAAKAIWLTIRSTKDGSGKYNWYAMVQDGDYQDFSPGWVRAAWKDIDIYGYVHNTAGWIQLWEGGKKLVEITGQDTYFGSDYDQVRLGVVSEAAAASDWCFQFDNLVVNDDASPQPPASGYGSPLRRGIISPWRNNQRNARGQVNGVWPASREWVH